MDCLRITLYLLLLLVTLCCFNNATSGLALDEARKPKAKPRTSRPRRERARQTLGAQEAVVGQGAQEAVVGQGAQEAVVEQEAEPPFAYMDNYPEQAQQEADDARYASELYEDLMKRTGATLKEEEVAAAEAKRQLTEAKNDLNLAQEKLAQAEIAERNLPALTKQLSELNTKMEGLRSKGTKSPYEGIEDGETISTMDPSLDSEVMHSMQQLSNEEALENAQEAIAQIHRSKKEAIEAVRAASNNLDALEQKYPVEAAQGYTFKYTKVARLSPQDPLLGPFNNA